MWCEASILFGSVRDYVVRHKLLHVIKISALAELSLRGINEGCVVTPEKGKVPRSVEGMSFVES